MTSAGLVIAGIVVIVCIVLACLVTTVVLVVKLIRSSRARDRALAEYKAAVEGRRP